LYFPAPITRSQYLSFTRFLETKHSVKMLPNNSKVKETDGLQPTERLLENIRLPSSYLSLLMAAQTLVINKTYFSADTCIYTSILKDHAKQDRYIPVASCC
jgi:hypothetical protein